MDCNGLFASADWARQGDTYSLCVYRCCEWRHGTDVTTSLVQQKKCLHGRCFLQVKRGVFNLCRLALQMMASLCPQLMRRDVAVSHVWCFNYAFGYKAEPCLFCIPVSGCRVSNI